MSYDIEYAPLKTGGDFPFPIEDVRLPVRNCLRGNVLVKADHVKLELSPDHITEILRCQSDPIYFFSKYVRINALGKGLVPFEVFDYQKEVIKAFNENRFSCVCMARQLGKCVTKNTFINIKNKKTLDEYYLPIGEYHQFIKDKAHDISKFKLSRKDYIDLSKLNFNF